MKKIAIFTGLALVIGLTACDKKFSDLEASPNSPAEATPQVLLTNCEVATFQQYTANTARVLSVWTNQGAGCDFQYIDLGNYIYNEQDVENDWSNLYTNNLINLKTLIEKTEAESPHYSGIAKILMGMNYGLATDLWGDIPMSQALGGLDGEFNASYDSQEDVLKAVIKLFDDGIADLDKASVLMPGADDIIYGGNIDMWKKAGYALKARYAMRYSKRDPGTAASDALAAIPNAISSNAENMMAIFGSSNNNANQWYAFINNRGGYYQIRDSFIDMFFDGTNVTDGRCSFYFTTADDSAGYYRGAAGGSPDPGASTVGNLFASIDSPLPMVTYFEMKFIEAEAKLMNGDEAGAKTALGEAVDASFEFVTGAVDTAYTPQVMSDYDAAADAAAKMEVVMTEKYKAMFIQTEVYSDWRRTGLPNLTPQPGAALGEIPRRWPTPQSERLYNTNAKVVNNLLTRVWWDQ